MTTALLTPASPCQACGDPVARTGRPGRPSAYCDDECRRLGRAVARAERDAYDIGLLSGDEYVPGAAHLDRWTATEAEARAATYDQYGAGLSAAYVPDKYRALSRRDHPDVFPGDEVGQTSPGIGRTLGAADRPHDWDRQDRS